MDFNRAEPTCYMANFPYASSGYQNGAFSYILNTRNAPYLHLRLDSILELCHAFPIYPESLLEPLLFTHNQFKQSDTYQNISKSRLC